MKLEHIGMVGYGEVGKIFTEGLLSKVLDVSAWDLKFDATLTPATARDAELAHAAQAGVLAKESMKGISYIRPKYHPALVRLDLVEGTKTRNF